MPLRDELNGYLKLRKSFFGIPEQTEGNPDVGILGIPYDLTSSHTPGARYGPDAIRIATDSERSHSYPLTIGNGKQYPPKSLTEEITIEDVGDLEVTVRLPEPAFYDIVDAASKLANSSSNLLFLGGDHFITYPLIRGLTRGRDDTLGLIYLDSHADYYESYSGHPFSHATTLKRIVQDGLVNIENVAAHDVRAALPNQRKEIFGTEFPPVTFDDFKSRVSEIGDRVDRLYISVDLDVLKPEIMPGVAHPESGGLSMENLVEILRACFSTNLVWYADVVELNPLVDTTHLSSTTARDVVKELLSGFAFHKT